MTSIPGTLLPATSAQSPAEHAAINRPTNPSIPTTSAKQRNSLPLVYSCSGCSSAAQMANHLALRLAREGRADMSCIAGVGGGVGPLVHLARQARPILALDGCPLHCVSACLRQQGLSATIHVDLSEHGVKKRKYADFCPRQAALIWQKLILPTLLNMEAGE